MLNKLELGTDFEGLASSKVSVPSAACSRRTNFWGGLADVGAVPQDDSGRRPYRVTDVGLQTQPLPIRYQIWLHQSW